MENTNDGLSQYFDESMQCNQEASKRLEIMGELTKSNLNDLFENSQDCIAETEKTKFNFINFLHSTPNQLNKDGVSKRKVPFSVEKNLENEEYKKPKLDFQKNHNDPFSAFNETFEDMKDCFEKNVHNVVISSENNELGKFNNSQYAKEVLKTFDDFETTLCQDNQEDVKEHNFDLKYEEFEELFQNSEDVLLDNRKTPVEDHQLLGAFYGLPDVAKTLIKQYKGIETLYGMNIIMKIIFILTILVNIFFRLAA